MADTIKNFGGFKVINGSAAGFNLSGLTDKTVIYFVRTDAGKEDGFIYFNGKKYGTGKLSSKAVQDKLTELTTKVENHIANKATVTATARTSGTTDNGNITANDSEKWLSGAAIEQIKTYVDSEDVKNMVLTGNKIQLRNKSNVVLAELDATKFIKDGMLESVTLVQDNTKGKVLRFTWNTDSGKDKTTTDIEVSDFFHEISGDNNTITVTQPASGTGSLKISAKTVADVSGVTSGATALMTGGITQQYVAQEINTLKTGLDSTLPLSAKIGSVTYATANIVQTDGKLSDLNSGLELKVATGLTTEHAGFVYNSTAHTFTAQASAFDKQGLLDAQDVITLLRNNNTNVANALTYLKGQIPTVKGVGYISVTKSGTEYSVNASDSLEAAIANANSAVQSVNGKYGQDVTLTTDDIKPKERPSGYPEVDWDENVTVTNVLSDIYDKINQTNNDALTSVSGSDSINVGQKASGSQTISVKAKPLSDTEKAAGQIEIKTDAKGIYGLLYFGGDDVEA